MWCGRVAASRCHPAPSGIEVQVEGIVLCLSDTSASGLTWENKVEIIEGIFKVMAGFMGQAPVNTSAAPNPKTTSLGAVAATDYRHLFGSGSLGKSFTRVLNGS